MRQHARPGAGTVCYLGIGSNLGRRKKNIELAIKKIRGLKCTRLIAASSIIETDPVGGPAGQGKFLNAALKIKTRLEPQELLRQLKRIEKELGRCRTRYRNGPRTIDLDILFYGDRVVRSRGLIIPHPRIFERQFVTRPLSEIL